MPKYQQRKFRLAATGIIARTRSPTRSGKVVQGAKAKWSIPRYRHEKVRMIPASKRNPLQGTPDHPGFGQQAFHKGKRTDVVVA